MVIPLESDKYGIMNAMVEPLKSIYLMANVSKILSRGLMFFPFYLTFQYEMHDITQSD